MSAKTVRSRFSIFLCLVAVCSVSSPTETVRKEFLQDAINNNLLDEMRLPELAKLIVVTDAEEMNGMDQLIRLKGTTSSQNAEAVTHLLRAQNFTDQDEDVFFVTGDSDGWWNIDGTVTKTKSFKRNMTGEETLVKLVTTSEGERWILLEQVGL